MGQEEVLEGGSHLFERSLENIAAVRSVNNGCLTSADNHINIRVLRGRNKGLDGQVIFTHVFSRPDGDADENPFPLGWMSFASGEDHGAVPKIFSTWVALSRPAVSSILETMSGADAVPTV